MVDGDKTAYGINDKEIAWKTDKEYKFHNVKEYKKIDVPKGKIQTPLEAKEDKDNKEIWRNV